MVSRRVALEGCRVLIATWMARMRGPWIERGNVDLRGREERKRRGGQMRNAGYNGVENGAGRATRRGRARKQPALPLFGHQSSRHGHMYDASPYCPTAMASACYPEDSRKRIGWSKEEW